MNWLFKEEPTHYNFDALVRDDDELAIAAITVAAVRLQHCLAPRFVLILNKLLDLLTRVREDLSRVVFEH